MCGQHGEHGYGPGPGFGRRGGPGRGFRRGFGPGGFPTRDEWLERLEEHRERLERDLANVRDLIERLRGDAPPSPGAM